MTKTIEKKQYAKPSMVVVELKVHPQLLNGSSLPFGDPSTPSPDQW